MLQMVREERLELSRRKTLEPKSSASTNSATLARYLQFATKVAVVPMLLTVTFIAG